MAHDASPSADPVVRALTRAHGVLPDQGPIGVFVHHNTLHAFQHLPFHEGVQQGAAIIGARPYLDLHEYRSAWASGRIEDADVAAAIARVLGERGNEIIALPGVQRGQLWHAMLRDVVDESDAAGLRYRHAHAHASREPQPRGADVHALVMERLARSPRAPRAALQAPLRHRDALVALGAPDTDIVVHGELVRLCSVFLDHGQALTAMPNREQGFLRAVAGLYAHHEAEPPHCRGVRADMERVLVEGLTARDVIDESLAALGVSQDAAESFILSTALALPGWTGMFARLERHPEEFEGPGYATLESMLAVRLMYERRAVEYAAHACALPVDWSVLRARATMPNADSTYLDAWLLASLLESVATSVAAARTLLDGLSDASLADVWTEIDAFPPLHRRRVFHDAYERRYRRQILDGVAALRRHHPPAPEPQRLDAQFVFCIDEREESIRRALEEQSNAFETFGVAGFFGIAIDYLGLYDEAPAAHCPVVITPAHEVHESARPGAQHWHIKRTGLRDRWRAASRLVHRGSRTLSGGAGLSFMLGPLAAALALSRVIAPRTSLAIADGARDRWVPRPDTQLSAIRRDDGIARSERGKFVGFTLDESIERVLGTLRAIGMIERFAPVVMILGHGSTSLNNPHESAHDCGACGGRRGGTNARLFAEMVNDPDVREGLRARGLTVPADVWFIGGLHDTSDDSVTLYDLERMPVSHADAFQRAHDALDAARRESAAERCRRFENAPLGISADDALRHVQARASHLAQPRPEYGHCTNAVCVVGRRSITRGLHLDRRSFLVSYDPTTDANSLILERILAAVGPVGAGISLEYYFSSIDNERFGCGTKLPHNVTGLVGVMAGHQGDLRTGLPLQMVEIHEPMRLLLIVDATPESLLAVAGRQAEVAELVVNEWVQLVSCDPDTGVMQLFQDGAFVPYVPSDGEPRRVERSRDWHMQGRQHLPPAIVTRALRMRAHV